MGMKFDSRPGQFINDVFVDGSDAYANRKKAWITFRYPVNNRAVVFKAFITSFSDTFSPNFNREPVYGSMDGIAGYMETRRSISLGFDVVASSDEEAIGNLEKVQKLAQFMYPTYGDTIETPPIIRLGFMNMVTSLGEGENVNQRGVQIDNVPNGSYKATYDNHPESEELYGKEGLPGTVSSLTYDFNLQNNANNVTVGTGALFSKVISVSLGFEPLHEHLIDGSIISKNTNFPYGVNLENLSPELSNKLVVDHYKALSEDKYGTSAPSRETYLAEAREAFITRVEAGEATRIDSENIQSGAQYFNNVKQEHQERLSKLKQSQQQLDMAEARYNSLFGKQRLKRDERVAERREDSRRGQRANQNLTAYNQGQDGVDAVERALTDPYDFESGY